LRRSKRATAGCSSSWLTGFDTDSAKRRKRPASLQHNSVLETGVIRQPMRDVTVEYVTEQTEYKVNQEKHAPEQEDCEETHVEKHPSVQPECDVINNELIATTNTEFYAGCDFEQSSLNISVDQVSICEFEYDCLNISIGNLLTSVEIEQELMQYYSNAGADQLISIDQFIPNTAQPDIDQREQEVIAEISINKSASVVGILQVRNSHYDYL